MMRGTTGTTGSTYQDFSFTLFKKNKGRKALRQSNNVFKDFASFHFKGEFVCRQ